MTSDEASGFVLIGIMIVLSIILVIYIIKYNEQEDDEA